MKQHLLVSISDWWISTCHSGATWATRLATGYGSVICHFEIQGVWGFVVICMLHYSIYTWVLYSLRMILGVCLTLETLIHLTPAHTLSKAFSPLHQPSKLVYWDADDWVKYIVAHRRPPWLKKNKKKTPHKLTLGQMVLLVQSCSSWLSAIRSWRSHATVA